MYSSSTILMFSLGEGTHGFTLDPTIGEFVLTHPNVEIPKRGKIYSLNEANSPSWSPSLQRYVEDTSRYIGSMVGDVHRTLLYGGIFGYPANDRNVNGKLRLLYEAAPMSFLVQQVCMHDSVRGMRA